ncbi:hypothetical protein DMN91_000289, partial [Ooceraea biroi]
HITALLLAGGHPGRAPGRFRLRQEEANTGRLDHLRGMSSGAKRLVQSLRGRSGGRGTGGGRSDVGAGEEGVGGGGASTSATRLCHYDSGHELDEISVIGTAIGRGGEGLTTPTTPCHCRNIKYGSGQTLCSIAGLVPPTPAIHTHRAQSGGPYFEKAFLTICNSLDELVRALRTERREVLK